MQKGIYEGGFEIWEGEVDLLNYFKGNEVKGLKILELGAGSGIAGIYLSSNNLVDF